MMATHGEAVRALDELTFQTHSRTFASQGDHSKADALWLAIPKPKRVQVLSYYLRLQEARSQGRQIDNLFQPEQIEGIMALRSELDGYLWGKK